jgi:RNA polymerase sigma-54 factor
MVQGLQLSQRLSQSLVLSPQMQQSLALLQAPSLELKALVEQELEQNPVLEEVGAPETELQDKPVPEDEDAPAEPPFEAASEREVEAPADDFQAEFDQLVQMEQEWRDQFSPINAVSRRSPEEEEKRQFMFDSLTAGMSLAEILLEQVRDANFTDEQRGIAEHVVGNIDDYGYLKATIGELSAATGQPEQKISEVLKIIQAFDPPGVGATDLRECLMLQLERAGRQESLEYRIIRDFMNELGKRRIPEISRVTGQPVEEVQAALTRIARLCCRRFLCRSPATTLL